MQNKGKHYAISDLHGRYDLYEETIKRLSNKDTLFIIGDVIDRGVDGIRILEDIMRRQKNPMNGPKIVFLIGNHEMQFLDGTKIIQKKSLNKETIIEALRTEKMKEQFQKKGVFHLKLRELGLTEKECECLYIWMILNGGLESIANFLNKDNNNVNYDKILMIRRFLESSFITFKQKTATKDYLLVHSIPPKEDFWLQVIKNDGGILYKAIPDIIRRQMLEDRDDNAYINIRKYGITTICGHTPSEDGEIVVGDRFY